MRRTLALGLVLFLLAGCTTMQKSSVPTVNVPPVPVPPPQTVRVDGTNGRTLTEIHFTDRQHGWAGGPGITYVTADGGTTWAPGNRPALPPRPDMPPALPQGAAADAVCAVAPGKLLVATGQTVERSTDGGKSWAPVLQSPMTAMRGPADLQCVGGTGAAWVLFTSSAAMSRMSHVVYRTTDAGQTWEPMLVRGHGGTPELNKLGKSAIDAYPGHFDAVDANTAYFLGHCSPCENLGTSSITRTTDGGRTWKKDNLAFLGQATALDFVDSRHGWLLADTAGGTRILATADGGATWRIQYPAGSYAPARAVAMVTDTTGFGLGAPGLEGAVLATHDGGRTWAQVGVIPWSSDRRLPPPMYAEAISFVDEHQGWAVTPDGQLMHTTDGGVTWTAGPLPPDVKAVSGVAFATAATGCVVTPPAPNGSTIVLSSTDGGATWQPADSTGGVVACAGRLAGGGWLGTAPPGVTGSWTVLDARSDGTAWVKQDSGEVWATRDKGKTWQRYDWPQNNWRLTVQSLSYPSSGHGWAVTWGGLFIRTTTDDATWAIAQ
ncbi:MAG TPA: hypothetical protein VD969_05150 [Symbiobacteriaceae bacterium]|nr:hypothetical protein [Symbiobacteriaceae bacterium]